MESNPSRGKKFKKESEQQRKRRLKKLYPEKAAREKYLPKKKKKSEAIWTPEKYRLVVKGGTVVDREGKKLKIEGLRNLAVGFDELDLRHPERWSDSQKRKVRTFFHRVGKLQGQGKRIMRARGENLRYLHRVFHGQVPSKDFKVAWVPDSEPQFSVKEGMKKRPPKVRVLKEKTKKKGKTVEIPVAVSVERPEFKRVFVEFNKKKLVTEARKEISRAASKIPGAKVYYVAVDEFTSLYGETLDLVSRRILRWMEMYDGEQPLPKESGNYGDDPRHHHWSRWLNGLVGLQVPTYKSAIKAARLIGQGRREAQEMQKRRKNFLKRIEANKRKGRK